VTLVLVGLGSNQGDSLGIVRRALVALGALACGPVHASSLWCTSPVDCPPGSPDFINAVAAFHVAAGATPEQLIAALKRLEAEFGRIGAARNAPRVLDLDLLVFGDEQRTTAALTLPHPRAARRRFVLAPAAEVAPHLVWPGTSRTVAELLAALDSAEQVVPVADVGG
jgi:2-amino-4-hydroxy-6-hydroxymethyldihydropteridine diphosphokinase